MKKYSIVIALVLALTVSMLATTASVSAAAAAPKNVKAVAATSVSIIVSWDAVKSVAGYGVYVSNTKNGTYTLAGNATSTDWTVTGLNANTAYYFQVKSYTISGKKFVYGSASATVSGKTLAAGNVATDYKNVVMLANGGVLIVQMSAEGYSVNNGPKEKITDGGAQRHLAFVWAENMGNPDEKDAAIIKQNAADQKIAPRYFRVDLKKAQKVGKTAGASFYKFVTSGKLPFIDFFSIDKYNSANMPKTATKVYFDTWDDGYFIDNKTSRQTDSWSTKYVASILAKVKKVKAAAPNATIYVGSPMPFTQSFPRFEIPGNKWADIFAMLSWKVNIDNMTFKNMCIDKMQKMCADNGFVFVNFKKSGLTDAQGYLQEQYVHSLSQGCHLNQAGLTIAGDFLCTQMGIKTAKQMYNLK